MRIKAQNLTTLNDTCIGHAQARVRTAIAVTLSKIFDKFSSFLNTDDHMLFDTIFQLFIFLQSTECEKAHKIDRNTSMRKSSRKTFVQFVVEYFAYFWNFVLKKKKRKRFNGGC